MILVQLSYCWSYVHFAIAEVASANNNIECGSFDILISLIMLNPQVHSLCFVYPTTSVPEACIVFLFPLCSRILFCTNPLVSFVTNSTIREYCSYNVCTDGKIIQSEIRNFGFMESDFLDLNLVFKSENIWIWILNIPARKPKTKT